jgi:autotransporter-associated beta strand protein
MWMMNRDHAVSRRSRKPGRRARARRSELEALEGRLLLTTRTWDGASDLGGASPDANWTTSLNWVGDQAPKAGDDLVFPATAAQRTNRNTFPAFTAFSKITFTGGSYRISGNIIALGPNGIDDSDPSTSSLNIIQLDGIVLTDPLEPFNVATPNADLRIDSVMVGPGGFNKLGAGDLVLTSNASNYTGAVTVTAGNVFLQAANGLGSSSAGTEVLDGGSLILTTGSGTPAIAEPLTLHGSGGFHAAVDTASNDNLTGPITLVGEPVFKVRPPNRLTLSGQVTGTGGFDKIGTGTMALAGTASNDFQGTAFPREGPLELGKASGTAIPGPLQVGSATVAVVKLTASNQIADTSAVTINPNGVLDLNGLVDAIGPLAMSGGRITTGIGTLTLLGDVTVNGNPVASQVNGNLSLGGATRRFTTNAGRDLFVDAKIVGGGVSAGLIKDGAGRMELAAANNFNGFTSVRAGTLTIRDAGALGSAAGLGTSGTEVLSGATLEVIGSLSVPEPLSLSGTLSVPGGAGANTWRGSVTLPASATMAVAGTAAGDSLTVTGLISGPAGLTKTGAGLLTFAGTASNTYAGQMRVNQGTLRLNQAVGKIGLPGDLAIGNSLQNAQVIELPNVIGGSIVPGSGSGQIAATSAVSVTSHGDLNLLGNSNTIASLTMAGGLVETGAGGVLTLNGNVAVHAGTTVSTISGHLNLGGAVRTFDVDKGLFADDLVVSAQVSGPAGSDLIKQGNGTMLLTGPAGNNYAGVTRVNGGVLALDNASSLGSASGNTIVSGGATLQLDGPVTVGEPLHLNGAGFNGQGALHSTGDTVNWSGPIALDSDSTVSVDAGTQLTVSGLISGNGVLTKAGGGVLALTANNTYSHGTVLNAGTLRVNGNQSNSPVTQNGGTLEGTGTIGSLTSHGGVVSPGSPGNAAGILRVSGNLTLSPATTYRVQINGPTPGVNMDQLEVIGANPVVALNNAILSVSLGGGFVPAVGTTLDILRNDGPNAVIPGFAGLPTSGSIITIGGLQFRINYSGADFNDVTLTRI